MKPEETSPPQAIQLAAADNVAVARQDLAPGSTVLVNGRAVTVSQPIASGHKLALVDIARGEAVLKYGQGIGVASADIAAGQHVHVHNVGMAESSHAHAAGAGYRPTAPAETPLSFEGYVRDDGRVATRNYLGVISSVNCSATVCRHIAEAFKGEALAAFPHVDGVVAITHGSGCGMGGNGEGLELLQRTLRGYANHPNFAGVLVIGLGCEVNQIAPLVETLQARDPGMFATLTIQDEGGTREAIAHGKQLIAEMLQQANRARRQTVPLSHLTVGLQCGGSDGYSGISANPALGAAVDLLVQHGGTAILSETPEIYGASRRV